MELSFLEQASTWGRVFEIAVQRGVLTQLMYQGLIKADCPVLEPWRASKIADVHAQLARTLNLTDTNAKEWAGSMVRHLLVLGYGLGWSAMRECLKHSPIGKAKLEAIWCPLTLPGQQQEREREVEETARAFHAAFNLPGQPDLSLLQLGQPARADFLLWLSRDVIAQSAKRDRQSITSKKCEDLILCLEFSYNAPTKLADFRTEEPHREEIARYARYIDSRGVFSRVCAEVEGEEFLLSSNLASHLPAFSGVDKPLFKLCQASSYTERLIHLLRAYGKLQGTCSARAIAVTPNGLESLAARFVGMEEPDPRARLMKSLGEAYRNVRKLSDDAPDELEREIRVAFKKLVRSLPANFTQQAKQLIQQPSLGGHLHFLFQENVEGFYNPTQKISRAEAIAAVEETPALIELFGGSPKSRIAAALAQQEPQNEQIELRQVHEAAVIAGLESARSGVLNVSALEGNPGIGKTTAVMKFLKRQSEGYLFLYLSPRVVINRDVTAKLARENGKASSILTITTNANLIASAPQWYEQQVNTGSQPRRCIDSAVVVDGIEGLIHPQQCSTLFVTPAQESEIDCNVAVSKRFKHSLNEREDSMESRHYPGVLRTLSSSARRLIAANPQVSRLVMTAAIQGYRTLDQSITTIDALSHLFLKKAQTKQGQGERLALSKRIPTVIVMVDELAGDGAGAPFAHKLADWLHQQFIEPFENTQSPFKVILIVADASLSNEVVFNSYLSSGDRAPDKVLISQSQGEAPFRVTGTYTKVGLKRHPILHIMTNSYPASELKIDYSIRLAPITPGLTSDGKKQTIRQAIREQSEDELLANAYQEIQRGLKCGSQQLIFFAQNKAFLRELKKKLTTGADALLARQVAVLDQNVPPPERLELVREPRRDEIRVFLMTSSGARGVSFPKTDWIIASIPRFNIETALMEVAQLIYRGRGMYTNPETGTPVSGDNTARQLVMLVNDFIVVDEGLDRSRLWLRQASDLLTLLVMLRSTIHTRIKGDAGLRKQRIAFVPVGLIGDEELLNPMFNDVKDFLREAQIFICDEHSAEAKAIVKRAEQLTWKIFADFNLTGQALDMNAQSYVNYRTLEALVKTVSRSSSRLLPSLENDALKIPDCLTCIGSFWMEDWGERKAEERFSFEGWRADVQEGSRHLLGLLRQIYEGIGFPPKLKRPAKELHKLLIREKDESVREYSTLQAMRTENIVVSLPLDYPHFWSEQLEEDARSQVLEPEAWKSALGRALTPQGLVMPVVPQYQAFPWAAVAGHRIFAQLETIFSDRYFMASNELNLLNTILLEDED